MSSVRKGSYDPRADFLLFGCNQNENLSAGKECYKKTWKKDTFIC